jgi:large subunit ribosomal protein L17
MRHGNAHRKLGRVSEHRIALLRNQATALLQHERIETTLPKAKELRPFVERLITIAKRGVKAADPKGKTLSARRLVMRDVHNEDVVVKLFDDLAPRFAERPGGYTRILKLGHRRGDAADMAQMELVGSEFDPKKAEAERKAAEEAAKGGETVAPKKSVGERLRSAAAALGGGKKAKGDAGAKSKASRPARAAAKKATTPRKAGGS